MLVRKTVKLLPTMKPQMVPAFFPTHYHLQVCQTIVHLVEIIETTPTEGSPVIVSLRKNVFTNISDGINNPIVVTHPLYMILTTRVTELAMIGTVVVDSMIVGTCTIVAIVVPTATTHVVIEIIGVYHTGNLPPATNSRIMTIHSRLVSRSTRPLGASLTMQSTGTAP